MPFSKDDLQRIADSVQSMVDNAKRSLDQVNAYLATWQDSPTPTPVPTPSGSLMKTAVHRYWGEGPKRIVDFYDLQHSQWIDLADFPGQKYRYASTARVLNDGPGDAQLLPISQTLSYGTTATRENGNDTLLNIGSSQLMDRIAKNLPTLLNGYDGLYLDEVDDTWLNGYPGTKPAQWSSPTVWQNAMVWFVTNLADAVHRFNKKLWVNLGLTNASSLLGRDAFRDRIVSAVDAVNIEYFVGRDYFVQPSAVDEVWQDDVARLALIEGQGKAVHAHCSSVNQDTIDYAFCSWLMGTAFLGSFCASVQYTGDTYPPSVAVWSSAAKLGRPLGAMGTVSTGWIRRFEHGSVYVNPSSVAMNGLRARGYQIVNAAR